MKVEKIHLLVHPGYLQNHHEDYIEYLNADFGIEDPTEELPIAEKPGTYDAYLQELLQRYVDTVDEMTDHEILIVLLPESAKKLAERMKKGGYEYDSEKINYIHVLQYLRHYLGRRMIVLTQFPNEYDDITLEGSSKEIGNEALYAKLDRFLHARDMTFDTQVLVDAFGESLTACVEQEAEDFFAQYELYNPVTIRTDKTDYDLAEYNHNADPTNVEGLRKNTHSKKGYRYK